MSKKDEVSDVDLKRKEQEATRDLKQLIGRVIEYIRRDFSKLIKDEEEAIKNYESVIEVYGRFGWREIFSDILKDEYKHLDKLRICLDSIEEVYKREGRIKPT